MTCVHRVRWSVKRPENCRFRLSVSHYKDRIVAPDEYTGATEVTPSEETQVLETKDRLVREDITVNPAPTEALSTTSNGTFTPSDGMVGFSAVTVDVNPDLRPLSVTQNGSYQPDGFDGYSGVTVNVPQKWDINVLASGTYDFSQDGGVLELDTATELPNNMFQGNTSLTNVIALNVETISGNAFYGCRNLVNVYFPRIKSITGQAFRNSGLAGNFQEMFPLIESIGDRAFQSTGFINLHLPETVKNLVVRSFNNILGLQKVYFHGTPTTIENAFDTWPSAHITDIYVPWSQGEVANAPWGATNATIHYNTVYDDDWNVISST